MQAGKSKGITWEQATAKPRFAPQILSQAYAYFRNDIPNGFGVGIGNDNLDSSLEDDLKQAFNASKKLWDESTPAEWRQIIADYMRQVEAVAALTAEEKKNLPTGETAVLIINLIWLVSAGKVPNDDFNGTQFLWAAKARSQKAGE
jgi:hypothetical protein